MTKSKKSEDSFWSPTQEERDEAATLVVEAQKSFAEGKMTFMSAAEAERSFEELIRTVEKVRTKTRRVLFPR